MLDAESSLGLVSGTNLFRGLQPDKPNDCVCIWDYSGRPPHLTMDSKSYEYPTVQIMVRSIKYDTGYTLIKNIMDSLHGRAQETWNGTLYSLIASSGSPAFLEWDEKNRAQFILNLNVQRR
jgi:hypothetical protein